MDWQAFGFKDDPLQTSPITRSTLALFTGHKDEVTICQRVLKGRNVRLVIEGARGVGTTSFANYLRFNAEAQKLYFTPFSEVKVEQGWRLETLLAAIISNFIRGIELLDMNETLISDERFKESKALSSRIAETYRSFGIDIFGFGANYGKQEGITQPIIVASSTLGHHLEDLIRLVQKAGYTNGALFQLNNLDVGEIHSEPDMKYLLNALRDYTQIEGSNWVFVGDKGLRKFIAQHVDRLDDIISYEVTLNPIAVDDLPEMITRRVNFFKESSKVEFPIDNDVFIYLYNITQGRLRYIFGLISRLLNRLHVGNLTDKITLDLAKPTLMALGRDRVKRADITTNEENILSYLVDNYPMTASQLANTVAKSSQYVGRIMANLVEKKLVSVQRDGRDKFYYPAIDAVIAYTKLDKT
jgi:Penicillinase repressor